MSISKVTVSLGLLLCIYGITLTESTEIFLNTFEQKTAPCKCICSQEWTDKVCAAPISAASTTTVFGVSADRSSRSHSPTQQPGIEEPQDCSKKCLNGGTLNTTPCTCLCYVDFTGPLCGTRRIAEPQDCSKKCLNGGTLNTTPCTCSCYVDFTGPLCGTRSYVGCYEDRTNRLIDGKQTDDATSMTISKCKDICTAEQTAYFGLELYSNCFCGNSPDFDSYSRRPEAECNTACVGDLLDTCGGTWRISVYRLW